MLLEFLSRPLFPSGVSGSAQYLVAQSAAHTVAMATLPGGRVHQVAVTALATPTNQPEQTVSTHIASYIISKRVYGSILYN